MFKHIELQEHSQECNIYSSNDNPFYSKHLCDLNPKQVLFFIDCNFYLITVPCCHNSSNHELAFQFLEQIKKLKVENKYGIYKSISKQDLIDFRLRGQDLKKFYSQVHYSYAGVQDTLFITSEIDYKQFFSDWNEKLEQSYKETLEYLNSKNIKLQDELLNLKMNNQLSLYVSEREIIKTTDHLIKHLKNYEASKQ